MDFEVGQKVWLWDNIHEDKEKHKKFDSLQLGPYEIFDKVSKNTYILSNGRAIIFPIPYNVIHLNKFYHLSINENKIKNIVMKKSP